MAARGAPASAYQTRSCTDCPDASCPSCEGEPCESCADAEDAADVVTTANDPWWLFYSDTSAQDRVLFGMWSYHLRDLESGAPSNGLMGIVYKGFVGATFITTHGPRGWVLGVERNWIAAGAGPAEVMLGYRAGLLYGYDGRLFRLAELTPVIPFFQPVVFMRAGRLTLDATYTYVVVSFTAGFRF